MLTLEGTTLFTGLTLIAVGSLRLGSGYALAGQSVSISAGAALDLNGIDATVGGLSGAGDVHLGTGILTIGGIGSPFSSLSGPIDGTGSLVFVAGNNPFAVRTLAGNNAFGGGTTLEGGTLRLGHAQALGTGPLTINGGQLRSQGSVSMATPIVLNADLLIGASNLTLGPASSITGAHAIDLRGEGSLTLQIASAHTGETRTGNGMPGAYTSTPGTIAFAGALGSAPDTFAFRIEGGGSLILDDRTAFTGPTGGRMGDATPVHLSSSFLQLTGNATTPSHEDIGTIHATGYSTITVAAPTTAGAHLNAAGLDRLERATFLFRGPNLGAPAGVGVANITFTSSPTDLIGGDGTGPEVSILPYAIGDATATGNGTGLVTYSAANGIRLLDPASEYASLSTATATSNVRLATTTVEFSPFTINALVLNGGASLRGSGTVIITSGILLVGQNTTIDQALNFDQTEANIFAVGARSTLSGAIGGSGGLTKSGMGTLFLQEANTFTGPLTINGGLLAFSSLENLGPETSPIVINASGSGAGLAFSGFQPLTLSRDIAVHSGLAKVETSATNSILTLAGAVTGPGGLQITGAGRVILPDAKTYLGPTVVEGGLAFSSDTALGNGGSLVLAGSAKVRLDGPWITDRLIELRGVSTLDTNGFDAVLNGPLVGESGGLLTKVGDGA